MATLKYGSKCAFNLLVLYPFYHVGEVTGWGVPIHLLVRRSSVVSTSYIDMYS